MRRLFFLAVGLLLLTASVTVVSAQIENLPWGVERIRGDLPWDEDRDLIVDPDANADQTIRVAVIDTGIANHPDLDSRVANGISYVEGKQYWEDDIGHGTHMARTIAAINNGSHLIGVAPRVDLYAVKVDPYDITHVIYGIYWAVDQGVHIISMSLAYTENNTYLKQACDYAHSQGIFLIAASGNENDCEVRYPAKYDSVVAVGAIDQNDERWMYGLFYGSNYGPELEFAAPGADINSTWPFASPYWVLSGTSCAVPHVTGTAALVFGSKVDPEYDSNENGQWDNFEVREKLRGTALDLDPPGQDGYYGYGLVNAWYSNQRPPGDITHDYIVDARDLAYVAFYYGAKRGDPDWWYARCSDITIDNEVDIFDLTIVALHYGQRDP